MFDNVSIKFLLYIGCKKGRETASIRTAVLIYSSVACFWPQVPQFQLVHPLVVLRGEGLDLARFTKILYTKIIKCLVSDLINL